MYLNNYYFELFCTLEFSNDCNCLKLLTGGPHGAAAESSVSFEHQRGQASESRAEDVQGPGARGGGRPRGAGGRLGGRRGPRGNHGRLCRYVCM